MAIGVRRNVDMINGPLWGKILSFSLTYMLTAILQHFYNMADSMIVGRYAGQLALAGVGTCGVLTGLFTNFILGFSAGSAIVLGQAIGSRDRNSISNSAHTAIAIAVFGGVIMSVACIIFNKPLLNMIDVPADVMPQASVYLRIVSIGFAPSLIYNFGAAILRSKGNTKSALYIVSISGLINVALNLLFVCVFKMEADGVALATLISQIFTAASIMYILCTEHDETKIFIKQIKIYKKPFLKILKLGLPSGIQSTVYAFSNIIVQSSINSFGASAVAGSAATAGLTDFYNVMSNSLYQSCLAFTSQNFGAKKFERIKQTVSICLVYAVAFWAIQMLVSFFFGETFITLYAPDSPEVVEWGMRKLSIHGYAYGLLGFTNIMTGALRGMGASLLNMITSIIGVCGIRIVWIMTVFRAFRTIEVLYWCYPMSWLGTFCMHFAMFLYVYKKHKKQAEKDHLSLE